MCIFSFLYLIENLISVFLMRLILIILQTSTIMSAILSSFSLSNIRVGKVSFNKGTFQLSLSDFQSTITSKVFFPKAFDNQASEIAIGFSGMSDIFISSLPVQIAGYSYDISNLTKDGFVFTLNEIGTRQSPNETNFFTISYIVTDNTLSSEIQLLNQQIILNDMNSNYSEVVHGTINCKSFDTEVLLIYSWCDSFQRFNNQISAENTSFYQYSAQLVTTGFVTITYIKSNNMRYLNVSVIIAKKQFLQNRNMFIIRFSSESNHWKQNINSNGIALSVLTGINGRKLNFSCKPLEGCKSQEQINVTIIKLRMCTQGCSYNSTDNNCYCNCPDRQFDILNQCRPCSEDCLTCRGESTNCTSCINQRILLNGKCNIQIINGNETGCLVGYYTEKNIGGDICKKCIAFCSNCTNNTTCVACALDSHRNQSANCSCQTGYYDNGSEFCHSCRSTCAICNSFHDCIQCQLSHSSYRILSNHSFGLMCIRNFFGSLEFVSQFFNFKVCRITFNPINQNLPIVPQQAYDLPPVNNLPASVGVAVGSDIKVSSTQFDLNISASNQSFQIYTDNKLVESYTLVKVQPTVIEVTFESDKHFSEISVAFPNSTLKVNNETYPGNLTLRTPAYGEYYTKQQIETTQKLGEVTKAFKDLADNGKGGFILIGLALFFADFIEFVNIMTLYAFIDIARPSNLESIFRDWISSLQITPFPMFRIDMPLTEYDGLFARPEIFERYDFSFNILSSFIVFAAQIAFFVVLYEVLTWISQRLGNNKFGNIMRHRFGPAAYSNGMECYLSAAINFGFCGAAVLLDTRIVGVYKSLNFACAIFVVFLTGITAVAHPIFLKQTKKLKYMDTQDCYLSAQRLSHSSEAYVHIKVLMNSVIALSIPLTSPLVCLILLTVAIIVKFIILLNTEFQKKWVKMLKMIGLLFHCLLNASFMVIYFANSNREEFSNQAYVILGWIAISFIILCLAVDVYIFVASIAIEIPRWLREFRGSQSQKQNNQVLPKKQKKSKLSQNGATKLTVKAPRARKLGADIIIQPSFIKDCIMEQPKQQSTSNIGTPSNLCSTTGIPKEQTLKKLSIRCFLQDNSSSSHPIKIKTCRSRVS